MLGITNLSKLKKLKSSGVKLIAVDYDGTVFDRNNSKYNNPIKVIKLINEVVSNKIDFVLISARNTTLEVGFRKLASQFCKKNNKTLTFWRSGGNGMNLAKITFTKDPEKIKIKKIYSNFISDKDVKITLDVYKKINIKLDNNSCIFFKQFLNKKLPEDLVSAKYLKLMLPYDGAVFIENVKISFVLPSSKKEQREIIKIFKKELEPYGLNVGYGGLPFVDISKQLKRNGKKVDGKLLAVKTIIKKLNINEKQVATFGDMPYGNDKGLLSLPYSFILSVVSVYKAIKFLVS